MRGRGENGAATRVLLVDDEEDLTASLRTGIRRATGWTIDTAGSGVEALDLLDAKTYDAVVSDERMPGMQGSTLLGIVRNRWPDAIRVTLSGQASLERAVAAINSASVHRYLLKPCPVEEVVATLRELLRAREYLEGRRAAAQAMVDGPRRALHDEFESALRSLWIAFQPIWTADGAVFGYEALVRSRSETLPTPRELFAAADSLERTLELGRRIQDVTAAALIDAPREATILANVDPEQLADERLYRPNAPLSAYADRVVFEITERRALTGVQDLARRVDRLTELGYRIAVDDLGAGFAGLSTFNQLEPTIVKFDASLVRNVDRSPTKQAVLGAMVTLCRSLGVQTVAEGIETEGEHECVRELGCDLFQGFLLGRPSREFLGARTEAA